MCKQAADDLRRLKDLGLTNSLFQSILPDGECTTMERHIRNCNPGPGRYKTHRKNDVNDVIRKRLFLLSVELDREEDPGPLRLQQIVNAYAELWKTEDLSARID